jgi:hypothetical protein
MYNGLILSPLRLNNKCEKVFMRSLIYLRHFRISRFQNNSFTSTAQITNNPINRIIREISVKVKRSVGDVKVLHLLVATLYYKYMQVCQKYTASSIAKWS